MYLVIGGTGTIGREVMRLLSARGERVRALVRDPFKASALAGPRVELVQADLSRPDTLPAAFDGASRVFLVTPPGPGTVPLQGAAVHAAKAAGVERLVRVSAMGAGTGMPVKIMTWHTEVEEATEAVGLPAVHLRPTSYMQNFLASAQVVKTAGQMYGASADGKVGFIDARDVAAAGVGALTRDQHRDEKVELTGPESLSGAEVAAAFSEVLGRPVAYVDIPGEALKQGLLSAGLPEWLVDDLVTLETLGRGRTMPLTDGVLRLAGKAPRSLRQFVSDFRAAFT